MPKVPVFTTKMPMMAKINKLTKQHSATVIDTENTLHVLALSLMKLR